MGGAVFRLILRNEDQGSIGIVEGGPEEKVSCVARLPDRSSKLFRYDPGVFAAFSLIVNLELEKRLRIDGGCVYGDVAFLDG